jgi:long-chain acyl-CoA synthetase
MMDNEARKLGISGTLDDSLNSDRVHAWVLARIKRSVAQFPSYATPRKIWLTLEPWTVSAGLMTPTLKLKRQAIERDFAKEIAELYAK